MLEIDETNVSKYRGNRHFKYHYAQNASEFDQETQQSHTSDKPIDEEAIWNTNTHKKTANHS